MKPDYAKSGARFALFCCLLLAAAGRLAALEITKDTVRLVLHEQSGSFSLYGLNADGRFEPFFSDEDPRTSFIEIYANNRMYRLGASSAFRFHVESVGETPAIVFESGDLHVREEFSFISTAGSGVVNGIRLTIRVRNQREGAPGVGLRFLLDTCLGEGRGRTPLFINNQGIPAETLVGGSVESPWVSRGASLSLMGSIRLGAAPAAGAASPGSPSGSSDGKSPDYLQIANWQRLSEASWKGQTRAGRNFDYPPYAFNDAALCYYYEPVPLPQYGELFCTILLAGEDPAGFVYSSNAAAAPTAAVPVTAPASAPPGSGQSARERGAALERERDLALLRNLIGRVNYYLEGHIEVSVAEFAEMEQTIALLKARYNIP